MITFEGTTNVWRIAGGTICRGRGKGGEEATGLITGKLNRIGVFEGTSDDGEDFKQLECDLIDAQDELGKHLGSVTVKTNIGLGPTNSNVTPFMFAQGLLETAKGEQIAIKPDLSNQESKYGTRATFVNVGVVNPATQTAKQVKRPKEAFPGESSKEKLPHALKELESHPAWAPRPKRDEDGGGADDFALEPTRDAYVQFCAVCEERKWPDPKAYPAQYLELAAKATKRADLKSLFDLTDDQLAMMAESVRKAKSIPAPLAAIAAEEYDPFADN